MWVPDSTEFTTCSDGEAGCASEFAATPFGEDVIVAKPQCGMPPTTVKLPPAQIMSSMNTSDLTAPFGLGSHSRGAAVTASSATRLANGLSPTLPKLPPA